MPKFLFMYVASTCLVIDIDIFDWYDIYRWLGVNIFYKSTLFCKFRWQLYAAGNLTEDNRVLIDIGTGYYVEKVSKCDQLKQISDITDPYF